MTRLVLTLFAFVLGTAFLAPSPIANAETLVFQTDMYGNQESPPVRTQAYGFVRFFFNDDRSAADYTVDVKGLATGLVLGADIHRGASGENGPIVKELAGPHFIVTAGRMRLSDDDLAEMADGMWYVSLKSVDHPDGEMRGQIVLPPGFLNRPLQRSKPPTPTPAPINQAPQPTFEVLSLPAPAGVAPAENRSNSVDSPVIRLVNAADPPPDEPEPSPSEPEHAPPDPAPQPAPPSAPSGVVVRPPNTGNAGLQR